MAITSEAFRDCLRHFPSGVTVVTIKSGERQHGLTVSSFASVSPDPPLVMIAIDHRHSGHALLKEQGATFAVNILGREQSEMSNRFAWIKDEDRFKEGKWGTAVTGAPVLQDALAWLDCTVYAAHVAGTHTIFVGEVQAGKAPRPDASPLVYWNRGYRHLALIEEQE
ncbi:MAG TPA: flavin reductase family protein [Anaerolineae bacterium]|jgi:flavin reductase (DIM6/NTAB) family NADH-FMN oxidoreductase RutF|nr:flavin reductase family protein [Anaerolineae bacterium]